MRYLLLIVFSFSLMSCSSFFKRRECNKTNWFKHGEKVAMSGQRLDEDDFVNTCRKVEADVSDAQLDRGFKKGMRIYCQPDTAYKTGRQGRPLSKDLCDGPGWKKLKARHAAGVREYCQPENGVSAGATGEAYNFICPKALERPFLVEFNKGRKRYLEGEVAQRREELKTINTDISTLKSERRQLQRQLTQVNRGGSITVRGGFKAIVINEKTTAEERKQAVDTLNDEIRSLRHQIRSKERERKTKMQQISELKREIVKL